MESFDLHSYDHYIVAFSGGKDSTAVVLDLLERGVPKEKIELWHHLIDGRGEPAFMDWEVTEDYCRKFAERFGLKIYFSWLDGGFKREMVRRNAAKATTFFETPDGLMHAGGNRKKTSTRCMFPQITANLSQRWCSAYLKIDVCSIAVNNQPRFDGKRVLILSGERAEESAGRANYKEFEVERKTYNQTRRTVHRYRPIHKWSEQRVWDIIRFWKVVVHPCYYIGFSRCSCKFCIFGNADQFTTAGVLSPEIFSLLCTYERWFGKTLKRKLSLPDLVGEGKVYKGLRAFPEKAKQALSHQYTDEIITKEWVLPLGAYGDSDGPQ